MYSKSHTSLGNFEVLEINNQDNSHKLSIIPKNGLLVNDLVIKHLHVIDGVENEDEVSDNPIFKSSLLAPFPNRIKDGAYAFNDQSYQLTINEAPRNNALHGFVYNKPFTLKKENYNTDSATLTFEYEYQGDIQGYPFPFKSLITWKLSDANGLELIMHFENTGDRSMPFGYGWHPYFKLKGNADDLSLKLPKVKKYESDEQLIATGELTDFEDYKAFKKIGDTFLDNCFKLLSDDDIVRTMIKDPDGNILQVWQEKGTQKFDYLQCFTPPHRKSIAIEPITCGIDAFNQNTGLIVLEPGESTSARMGISVN